MFTSDVGYVSDIKDSIDVWKAINIFNIKDNKLVNDFRLDNTIQSHLYKQFNNQLKKREIFSQLIKAIYFRLQHIMVQNILLALYLEKKGKYVKQN